jgi:uncharacterized membrane protein
MTLQPDPLVAAGRTRIASLDLLKGLVMIVMALDHTRDFFHFNAYFQSPTNPEVSTLPAFFARWITHFCAPVFSFLAGTSAFLVGMNKSRKDLSVFLLKRGLWLILIQVTVVNFAWTFDIQFRYNELAVIWSLGVSMIALAGLIHLPRSIIVSLGCVMIFGHNLLDTVNIQNVWWYLLHKDIPITFEDGRILFLVYPLIPWVGVMGLGYIFGQIFTKATPFEKRKSLLLTIGLASFALFLVLRWTNAYGDPVEWRVYDTFDKTLMSFLNLNKYPPSLLFILMTLGPALVFLSLTKKVKGKLVDIISTFGRVPFLYYILHLYVIHLLAIICAYPQGYGPHMVVLTNWVTDVPQLKGFGYPLSAVVVIWICIVVVLYFPCRWFDAYKSKHKEKRWLSYL